MQMYSEERTTSLSKQNTIWMEASGPFILTPDKMVERIMSCREKCPSVLTLGITTESPPKVFIKRETSIKPLKDRNERSLRPYPSSGVGYARGRY
jgi:hypothetical protein